MKRSTKDPKKTTANDTHTVRLRTDLAVFVNVLFEVVVFGDDGFGDERLVVDADGGQQGGTVRVSQPCDLCRLLVVLVVQVQASLHGHNLTISPSEWERKGESIHRRKSTSLL